MVDRLDCLRHDAVVGGNDKHHDVRNRSATGPHRGKGGVTGRVEKGDRLALVFNAISTDMLRDSSGFTGGDTRLADRVHQRRLTVIDMAHEGNDWGPWLEFLFFRRLRFRRRDDDLLNFMHAAAFFATFLFENESMSFRDLRRAVGLNGLIEIREDVEIHQLSNELMWL